MERSENLLFALLALIASFILFLILAGKRDKIVLIFEKCWVLVSAPLIVYWGVILFVGIFVIYPSIVLFKIVKSFTDLLFLIFILVILITVSMRASSKSDKKQSLYITGKVKINIPVSTSLTTHIVF